jgi:biotin carboxyl carrier protein
MIRILSEMIVYGPALTTNLPFLVQILRHKVFVDGQYTTHMIADHISEEERKKFMTVSEEVQGHVVTVATIVDWYVRHEQRQLLKHVASGFRNNPSRFALAFSPFFVIFFDWHLIVGMEWSFDTHNRNQFQNLQLHGKNFQVEYLAVPLTHKQQLDLYGSQRDVFNFQVWVPVGSPAAGNGPVNVTLHVRQGEVAENICGSIQGAVQVTIGSVTSVYNILHSSRHAQVFVHHPEIGGHIVKLKPRLVLKSNEDEDGAAGGLYKAHMSGKISKVVVTKGASVKSGTVLLLMESMKMETKVNAKEAGEVEAIYVKEGDIVQDGQPLLKLKQAEAPSK